MSKDCKEPGADGGTPEMDHLTLDELPKRHRAILDNAFWNFISTKAATLTFAQIVDGLPLAEVEQDTYHFGSLHPQHPLYRDHLSLCPGVMETYENLRLTFDLSKLSFPSAVGVLNLFSE